MAGLGVSAGAGHLHKADDHRDRILGSCHQNHGASPHACAVDPHRQYRAYHERPVSHCPPARCGKLLLLLLLPAFPPRWPLLTPFRKPRQMSNKARLLSEASCKQRYDFQSQLLDLGVCLFIACSPVHSNRLCVCADALLAAVFGLRSNGTIPCPPPGTLSSTTHSQCDVSPGARLLGVLRTCIVYDADRTLWLLLQLYCDLLHALPFISCHVILPCLAMSCHAFPCHAMPCHAFCHVLQLREHDDSV